MSLQDSTLLCVVDRERERSHFWVQNMNESYAAPEPAPGSRFALQTAQRRKLPGGVTTAPITEISEAQAPESKHPRRVD